MPESGSVAGPVTGLRNALEQLTSHAAFSPFHVFGRLRSERTHQRVLEWLFDPEANHGFGPSILHAVTRWVGVNPNEWSRPRLLRELPFTDGRLDLVVQDIVRHVAWIVELKTDGEDSPHQLDAYWLWSCRVFPDSLGWQRHYTYLTPRGSSPKYASIGEWQPLGYGVICAAIDQLVRKPLTPAGAFASAYSLALKEEFLDMGERNQERRLISLEYGDELTHIARLRDRDREIIKAGLMTLIQRVANEKWLKRRSGDLTFSPEEWPLSSENPKTLWFRFDHPDTYEVSVGLWFDPRRKAGLEFERALERLSSEQPSHQGVRRIWSVSLCDPRDLAGAIDSGDLNDLLSDSWQRLAAHGELSAIAARAHLILHEFGVVKLSTPSQD